MRRLSVVHPPAATRAILESLDLPARAPPTGPPVPEENEFMASRKRTSPSPTSEHGSQYAKMKVVSNYWSPRIRRKGGDRALRRASRTTSSIGIRLTPRAGRGALGRYALFDSALLTRIVLPPTVELLRFFIAAFASPALGISTNPKPLERPLV